MGCNTHTHSRILWTYGCTTHLCAFMSCGHVICRWVWPVHVSNGSQYYDPYPQHGWDVVRDMVGSMSELSHWQQYCYSPAVLTRDCDQSVSWMIQPWVQPRSNLAWCMLGVGELSDPRLKGFLKTKYWVLRGTSSAITWQEYNPVYEVRIR